MTKYLANKTEVTQMLVIEPNPFGDPILNFITEIKSITWEFPFIPQAIHLIVILALLLIFSMLYITIGIISQISTAFWNLIVNTGSKIKWDVMLEGSAYAIAIGIYFILFLPFFAVQFPFWLLGWLYKHTGAKGFVILSLLITIICYLFFATDPVPIKLWKTYISSTVKDTLVIDSLVVNKVESVQKKQSIKNSKVHSKLNGSKTKL